MYSKAYNIINLITRMNFGIQNRKNLNIWFIHNKINPRHFHPGMMLCFQFEKYLVLKPFLREQDII